VNYKIRKAQPEDLRFVLKTWLDSYRASHTSGLLSLTPHLEPCIHCNGYTDYGYHAVMAKVIRRILERPNVEVLVAANPRAQPPNDLHGYVIVERGALVPYYKPPRYELELRKSDAPLVHYVLVKKIYRDFKLARALFAAAGVDPTKRFLFTCTTPISESIRKAHKIPGGEWSPLCARFTKEQNHDQESEATPVHHPGAPADSG
jgi:hypothetical protein